MDLREARTLFLSHLDAERGCSPLTITAYRSDIGQLIRHRESVGRSLETGAVGTAELREFIVALRAGGLQARTLGRRISCLRSFFGSLVANGYVANDPARMLRTPKKSRKLPVTLTEDECRRLLDAAYQSNYTMLGFRDRAVSAVLIYTGIQRQEVLDLELGDVDAGEGRLRVCQGKGNKMRMVPLVGETISAIDDWLEFRPECETTRLFVTLNRRPLGRHGIQA